jgi:hypothetical protein
MTESSEKGCGCEDSISLWGESESTELDILGAEPEEPEDLDTWFQELAEAAVEDLEEGGEWESFVGVAGSFDLTAAELEDLTLAGEELEAAALELEGEGDEAATVDLIRLAKIHPGLKITISF